MKKIDLTRIAAVIVIILGIAYFYLNLFSPNLIPKAMRIGIIRKPFNLLILGTDISYDRITKKPMPNLKSRTDTILFAHIDPAKGQISMLSIPRDTLVNIPGYGKQKINFAHAWGGLNLTKEIIEKITRQKIDYYIELTPMAIPNIVNSIGGVTLYIEDNMRYRDHAQGLDINLKKGWQKLNGKQAHDYIRYRDNFRGDILRIEHQQNFLKSLSKEIIKPAKIIRSPFILYSTLQQIKTDMPVSKTIRLLNLARMLPLNNVHTLTVPGDATMEARVGSVWIIDEFSLENTLKEYF